MISWHDEVASTTMSFPPLNRRSYKLPHLAFGRAYTPWLPIIATHDNYMYELYFGAKYGEFLAAQKLPNLETLSCLQVVATFGNIEVCQNWQPQSFQEWKLLNKS